MKLHNILRIMLRVILILFCLFGILILYYYITSKSLTVTHYTVQSHISTKSTADEDAYGTGEETFAASDAIEDVDDVTDAKPLRIVQIADLHNAEFGEGNEDLISLVADQEPDLIFMTGDMLNRDDENTEIVSDLISNLCQIAPVYYGYGNHETAWERRWEGDLHELFGTAGAHVLECEYEDITVNGQDLRIGGYMAYWGVPHMMVSDLSQQEKENKFFEAYADTDRYKVLLNHIPTQWVDWHYIDHSSVDLVFCGHYHGGIVRIPIIDRGLIAPYVGWFPPYTKGCYEGETTTCILTAGLGSEYWVPRLNNPPEIVVTELLPLQ